jgi:hypothetical protein
MFSNDSMMDVVARNNLYSAAMDLLRCVCVGCGGGGEGGGRVGGGGWRGHCPGRGGGKWGVGAGTGQEEGCGWLGCVGWGRWSGQGRGLHHAAQDIMCMSLSVCFVVPAVCNCPLCAY